MSPCFAFSVFRQWIAHLATFACLIMCFSQAAAQTGELLTVKRPAELRSGPSATHSVVVALPVQSQLTRQPGRQGPWIEVKDAANNLGWVHMFDLSGASASGGNAATNALRGISSLFGGARANTAQISGTSTVGIRGLGAEDLARSQPNINAVLMMETLRIDAAQARSFAAEARLKSEPVEALPAPPAPPSPNDGNRP